MTWTPNLIRTACRKTSDQILVTERSNGSGFGIHPANRRTWTLVQTVQRLAWQYGDERAAQIMSRRDQATRDDISAWNTMGRKAAA